MRLLGVRRGQEPGDVVKCVWLNAMLAIPSTKEVSLVFVLPAATDLHFVLCYCPLSAKNKWVSAWRGPQNFVFLSFWWLRAVGDGNFFDAVAL